MLVSIKKVISGPRKTSFTIKVPDSSHVRLVWHFQPPMKTGLCFIISKNVPVYADAKFVAKFLEKPLLFRQNPHLSYAMLIAEGVIEHDRGYL